MHRARVSNYCVITPPWRKALRALEQVAETANQLGKLGHGVDRIEIIEGPCDDPRDFMERKYEVRVVPKFKLKVKTTTAHEKES